MSIKSASFSEAIPQFLHRIQKYAVPLFILFLIGIYGFLAWRIVTLNQAQPDQTAVQAKLKSAGVPHVDPEVVSKIQQLQDNSVEVQTLFDEARTNPFQE
ncbi:MAG TPA: hypothetical protein VF572_03070 [Candidatus Saccharimonadales bacterium]|jgi:predicted negative regulator of RcsB-dependent stress response